MDKNKIFNERTDKLMKRLGIWSIIIGVLALLTISALAIIVYQVEI